MMENLATSCRVMTWLYLVFVGVVALQTTRYSSAKQVRYLDQINPDSWPGLRQVPADVLAKAEFVVIGGGDFKGEDVLVHTTDSNTYVYGFHGNGEKTELRGISVKDAKVSMATLQNWIFFVLLTDGGEVYTVGIDDQWQFGDATSSDVSSVFSKVPGLTNVVEISAGLQHIQVLTGDGQVYFWGDIKDSATALSGPVKVDFADGFLAAHIASGSAHCLVLSKDGRTVMGYGANSKKQLGLGSGGPSTVSMTQPRAVPIPEGVKLDSIYAAGTTSFALDFSVKIWQWGDDKLGSLGHGGISQPTPTNDMPILKDRVVSSMRVWLWGSVAITTDNEVYRWGWYKDGLKMQATLVPNVTDTALDVLAKAQFPSTAGAVHLVTKKEPCTERYTKEPGKKVMGKTMPFRQHETIDACKSECSAMPACVGFNWNHSERPFWNTRCWIRTIKSVHFTSKAILDYYSLTRCD